MIGAAGCLDLFFIRVFIRSEWGCVGRNEHDDREPANVVKE